MKTEPHPHDSLDGLLTISLERLAEITSVRRTHIFAEMKAGNLKSLKMGRRTLVRISDARAWIDAAAAAREAAAA